MLEVKIKELVNFEILGALSLTAECVDCCRCVGGADEPLELPKGADDELVHKRMLS